MNKPLITVCCITYNHSRFIEKCLDGFLLQKTDFLIEFIIHDDASTDNTQELIKNKVKSDSRFNLILREKNIKSTGVAVFPLLFKEAKGKYIAMCEGDDYWTDPYKLQKQVDFLEGNEGYVLTVGGFKKVIHTTGEAETIIKEIPGVNRQSNGYTFELLDTTKGWITKTFTSLFRNDKNILQKFLEYNKGRDINLFYHILKTGKGFYFTEVFGVYNVHEGGLHSSNIGINNRIAAYEVYKELHLKNKDEFTRRMRFSHTLGLFNFLIKKHNKKSAYNPLKLYVEALILFRKFKEVKLLIAAIVK